MFIASNLQIAPAPSGAECKLHYQSYMALPRQRLASQVLSYKHRAPPEYFA